MTEGWRALFYCLFLIVGSVLFINFAFEQKEDEEEDDRSEEKEDDNDN